MPRQAGVPAAVEVSGETMPHRFEFLQTAAEHRDNPVVKPIPQHAEVAPGIAEDPAAAP